MGGRGGSSWGGGGLAPADVAAAVAAGPASWAARLEGGSGLGSGFTVTTLKFFICNQGVPRLHFALDPTNDYVGSWHCGTKALGH